MRLVALISGGKDSCYGMLHCIAAGHEIVALAHLKPKEDVELDSYMYQCAGHNAVEIFAEAMELPLYQGIITGSNVCSQNDYIETPGDEVEDLYSLLETIKKKENIQGVSGGAILSNYQRIRVENVCQRLGLVSFAYLWRRDQEKLLAEMIACGLHAVVVKVAVLGLNPEQHLGKPISELLPHLMQMNQKYGVNVCGEGGEYETFTLDCPLFKKKIIVDEQEIIIHSNDAFAPVGILKFNKLHLESKFGMTTLSQYDRVQEVGLCNPDYFLLDLSIRVLCQNEKVTADNLADGDVNVALSNLSELDCRLSPSVLFSPSGWFWISNLVARAGDPQTQMKTILQILNDMLKERDCSLSHIMSVQLYISDMKTFAALNESYKSYFNLNPPSRVCVQTVLPSDTIFILNCTGFKSNDQDTVVAQNIHHMHIQSISHWAPANIGPYSQAVQVGDYIHVAGQIGLVPATMEIINGGIKAQSRLSLRHVERILKAINDKASLRNIIFCACYVTHPSYIPIVKEEWAIACSEEKSNIFLQNCLVVPALPRDSLVEWQVVAHISHPEKWIWKHLETCTLDFVEVHYTIGLLQTQDHGILIAEWNLVETSNLNEEAVDKLFHHLISVISNYNANASVHFQVFGALSRETWTLLQSALKTLHNARCNVSLIPVLSYNGSSTKIGIRGHFC